MLADNGCPAPTASVRVGSPAVSAGANCPSAGRVYGRGIVMYVSDHSIVARGPFFTTIVVPSSSTATAAASTAAASTAAASTAAASTAAASLAATAAASTAATTAAASTAA